MIQWDNIDNVDDIDDGDNIDKSDHSNKPFIYDRFCRLFIKHFWDQIYVMMMISQSFCDVNFSNAFYCVFFVFNFVTLTLKLSRILSLNTQPADFA
jgi:hypothetical protein